MSIEQCSSVPTNGRHSHTGNDVTHNKNTTHLFEPPRLAHRRRRRHHVRRHNHRTINERRHSKVGDIMNDDGAYRGRRESNDQRRSPLLAFCTVTRRARRRRLRL